MSMLLKRGLWRQILLLRSRQATPHFAPLQHRLVPPVVVVATHSLPSSCSSFLFFSSAVEAENHASEEIDIAHKVQSPVSAECGTAHRLNEEGKDEKEGDAQEAEKLFAPGPVADAENIVPEEIETVQKLESQGSEEFATAHKLYEEGKASKGNVGKEEKEGPRVALNLEDEVRSLRAELEDQKTLIKSLIQDVNLLKSSTEAVKPNVSKVRLPEWNALLEHMKNCEFFKDDRKGNTKTRLFDDPASVKRALYKFSQAHESIYETLPQNDIKVLAQKGRVDDDQKAQSSLKRLRKHYELDAQEEDNVSGLPSIQPKLSDVMRLLYSTATLSQPDALAEDVKTSVVTLLKEIIRLSGMKKAKSKAPDVENIKDVLDKGQETKNIAKSTAKSDQWECPRCHFKNLDHKHRCVECSRRRPTKTYPAGKGKEEDSNSAEAIAATDLDEQFEGKLSLDGKVNKDLENKKKKNEGNGLSFSDGRDEGCDSDAEFLDDILDSDDSEDEKESGKKPPSSLSDLFDRRNSSPMKKKGEDRGRKSTARGKKKNYEEESDGDESDEDEPRARRGIGSKDEESDEDVHWPRGSSRGGFGDDSSRRMDRWDRNSSRSSSMRGGGRSSYDDRHGGGSRGGWRGGRSNGDRFGSSDRRDRNDDSYEDRGSRFGGRSRGRGRSTRY